MSKRDYRTYKFGSTVDKSANALTSKVEMLYELVSHKRIMSRSRRKEKLGAKIISVGNITFGGSGKTPHVELLAFHLSERGMKTGIAVGGWGGAERKDGILVSDGDTIHADFESAGDEAISMAQNVLENEIPVFAHWNRIRASKELIVRFDCDVIIMDDAYHFVSVEKDADILLIDSLNPLGDGPLPNRGLMREPFSAICRADSIILTHTDQSRSNALDDLNILIKAEEFNNPVFQSSYEPRSFVQPDENFSEIEITKKIKLIPLSGIGNPESFEISLESRGVINANPIRFNDHHTYTKNDINAINIAIDEDSADGIVTTQKDWVRLMNHSDSIKGSIYILRSEIIIDSEFLEWIDNRI